MSAIMLAREVARAPAVAAPAATAYRPADRVDGALELLGIRVHDVSATGVLDYMGTVICGRHQAVILHANAFAANLAGRHDWMRQAFRDAQMVFCDGDGIRMACRALGLATPPKVTYARWLPLVADWCERHGHSIYLLGGRPGVAELAARRFQERHPRIRIAGTHHGYFEKSGPESDAVAAAINRERPDVLLVCFGMPIQEQWVQAHAAKLATHVVLTGGAALDYAAGTAIPTPPLMVRLQLEWLYRLWKEPRRLFTRYVIGNPEFILRVLAERARRTLKRRGGP
jgi:N-acetylglucosaminyldiphosphoundecaprenol N-acetyl-beta-D-mannosaminyltransferase